MCQHSSFLPLQSFVADFASTSREDVFSGSDKVQLLNQVICQHFYRQGMLDIADELAQVMPLLVLITLGLVINTIMTTIMLGYKQICLNLAHLIINEVPKIHFNTIFPSHRPSRLV
jgi:hypothetical protein